MKVPPKCTYQPSTVSACVLPKLHIQTPGTRGVAGAGGAWSSPPGVVLTSSPGPWEAMQRGQTIKGLQICLRCYMAVFRTSTSHQPEPVARDGEGTKQRR